MRANRAKLLLQILLISLLLSPHAAEYVDSGSLSAFSTPVQLCHKGPRRTISSLSRPSFALTSISNSRAPIPMAVVMLGDPSSTIPSARSSRPSSQQQHEVQTSGEKTEKPWSPSDLELREEICKLEAVNPAIGTSKIRMAIKEQRPEWALSHQRVLKMRRKMREDVGEVARNAADEDGVRVPSEEELIAAIAQIHNDNPEFGTARVAASIKLLFPNWAVRTSRILKLRRRMREEHQEDANQEEVQEEQSNEQNEEKPSTGKSIAVVSERVSDTSLQQNVNDQATASEGGEAVLEPVQSLTAPPRRDKIIDSILLYQRHFHLLIDLEQDEQEEAITWRLKKWPSARLEEEGLSVVGLHARPVGEVYGEKILELSTGFGARNQDGGWLFRKYKAGDVVLISSGFSSPFHNKVPSVEGIVCDVGGAFLHVAVQSWPAGVWSGRRRAEFGDKLFRVDKFYSALPFQRMRAALRAAEEPLAMSEPLRRLIFQSPIRYYMPDDIADKARGQFGASISQLPAVPAPPEGWELFTSLPPAVQLDGRQELRQEEVEEAVNAVAVKHGCNPSQRAAMLKAIQRQCTVIQGPPGTGKTFTASCVVEALLRLKRRGHGDGVSTHAILATAHSNTATDNLMEKLQSSGISVVRVGRTATVATHLRGFTLDALLDGDSDITRLRSLMFGAIDATQVALQHQLAGQRIESTARILGSVDVVVASLIGSGHESLARIMDDNRIRFHTVVMDEASQATEPSALIPLVRGCQRLVLVGDQCQLPPTVISRESQLNGLSDSLFARLVRQGLEPSLLNVQFRMHPSLALFPSVTFYGGKVISSPSPADRPPPASFPFPNPSFPVAFVHVRRNSDMGDEQRSGDGKSFANYGEAILVARIVEELVRDSERCDNHVEDDEAWLDEWTDGEWDDDNNKAGIGTAGEEEAGRAGVVGGPVRSEDIGVISGYAGQVLHLRELLEERAIMVGGAPLRRVEVNTVDAFQGREKEFMVISTVRSNAVNSLGFLSDWRRLNVALTRAKRGVVIVGDEHTLRCDPYWERLLDLLDERECFLSEAALLAKLGSTKDIE